MRISRDRGKADDALIMNLEAGLCVCSANVKRKIQMNASEGFSVKKMTES